MNPTVSQRSRTRFPRRAKNVFALTALLIIACFCARSTDVQAARWQKWVLDASMLTMVAFSSLIWATYRHQDTLTREQASPELPPAVSDEKAHMEQTPR